MSQTHNPSKSGARRRNQNRNQRRPGQSGHSGHTTGSKSQAARKPSLGQRLLGLFGLGKKNTSTKGVSPAGGTVTRESIPSRHHPKSRTAGESGTPRAPRERREPRTPEVVEVTNPRLYIGNLSYDATETDFQEIFNGVGRVVSVEIVTNSRTQRSKGYGFVEMGTTEEAKRAVETLHDKEVMGRKMVVSGAKPKDDSHGEA